MQVRTELNYLRIAPRKVRLAADLIRKKEIEKARTILTFTTKKATKPLLKLLETAVADARHNFQLDPANLYISKITVDEGPRYKRWRPRSRGMTHAIQKKTSHITLILDEIAPTKKVKKVKKAKVKQAAPKKRSSSVKTIEDKEEKELDLRKSKPRPELEISKPKTEKGIRRIFRRKAF